MRCALALLALLAAGCASWRTLVPRAVAMEERLAALPVAPAPAARLLFVTIAGLEPASWAPPAVGAPPTMPTAAALASLGVSADYASGVAPPSAYPVHATLVTGRAPRAHGISAEFRIGAHGVRLERYSHASQLRGPMLWQLAADRRVPVAALDWPSTLGAAIEMLLPDVAPTRRGERYADLLTAAASAELAAAVAALGEAADAAALPGAEHDRLLVDLACVLAARPRPPALLLLRLTQTEPALRAAGPGSSAVQQAFAAADRELARLLGCFDAAGLLADAAVALAGDRTFEPIHSVVLPNVALAEARLVDLEPIGTVAGWSALARSNGGSAFVYAADEARALEAREVLLGMARRTGAFRVVSASEMSQLGADPEAWFGLDAAAGFAFGDAARGPHVAPSAERGASGRLRSESSATPAVVFFGRGFRRGVRVPRMSQLDVAPTLAAALGLSIDGAEGRALVGLLEGGPSSLGR